MEPHTCVTRCLTPCLSILPPQLTLEADFIMIMSFLMPHKGLEVNTYQQYKQFTLFCGCLTHLASDWGL